MRLLPVNRVGLTASTAALATQSPALESAVAGATTPADLSPNASSTDAPSTDSPSPTPPTSATPSATPSATLWAGAAALVLLVLVVASALRPHDTSIEEDVARRYGE